MTSLAGLHPQPISLDGFVILADNAELCVFAVRADQQKIPFPVIHLLLAKRY